MNNAAKLVDKRKNKEPKQPKAKRLKFDLSTMDDAIVDGKLIVPIKGEVIFERVVDKRKEIHRGFIFNEDSDGVVTVWDTTAEVFYIFSLRQTLPVMKAFNVQPKTT